MKKRLLLSLAPFTLICASTMATEIISGDIFSFTSLNLVSENCIITEKLDEELYSKKDLKKEKEFCELDLYENANLGVCPKTWSTSPGTIIYKLAGTSYENRKVEFESEVCGSGKTKQFKSIAKFKNSMNQEGTSGTYSASNLAYYHMSRFLDTSVEVPVSVYREIDKQEHLKRAKLGQSSSPAGMIRNGWKHTISAILDPSSYRPSSDLFTNDNQKIYGVMLKDSGERYGAEINGIRSEWGVQSSIDFSKTPAFMALSNPEELIHSINEAVYAYPAYLKAETKKHGGGLFKKKNAEALSNLNTLKAALPLISKAQMIFWMKELSEIVILDTIFGQQDRIGNIDYKWFAYSIDENGKLIEEKLDSAAPFVKLADVKASVRNMNSPVVVQRTMMGDNDAGVRTGYVNFSKNAKLIESVSHISDKTYEQLKKLVLDLNSSGDIYTKFSQSYGLKSKEVEQIVLNTNYVFQVLKAKCEKKQLKFDLAPKEYLKTKNVVEKSVSCE